MHPDLRETTQRIASLRALSARTPPPGLLLEEIEDVLTGGYARALEGDAWSMRTERRLNELISDGRVSIRGRELRLLATEHAGFQRELIALRRELAALRRDRDRLREGVSVRPA